MSGSEQRTKRVRMDLHPAEAALIKDIRDLEFGEIERIKVSDGLPAEAEVVTRKKRYLKPTE